MKKLGKDTIYKILGLLVTGVVLLIVSNQFKNPVQGGDKPLETKTLISTNNEVKEARGSESYEVEMEKRLESILKNMQGVGKVEVMITTTYGKEIILAQDLTSHSTTTIEEDTEGGTRQISSQDEQTKVVMQSLNVAAGNEPVVIKEKQPEIQGVLVIAQGAGNSLVKQSIVESTQILLGIPAHRVTVHQLQMQKK